MIMGVVGRIEIYDKQEVSRSNLEELEYSYNLKYIGENTDYYFGYTHATDVQIPTDASIKIRENYKNLEKEFDSVITGIKFTTVSYNNKDSPQPLTVGIVPPSNYIFKIHNYL